MRSVSIIQQISYEIKNKVYADQKLSLYNFYQTPYGADKINIIGQLELNQRDAYEMGSVKRIVNYESDDLQKYIAKDSL